MSLFKGTQLLPLDDRTEGMVLKSAPYALPLFLMGVAAFPLPSGSSELGNCLPRQINLRNRVTRAFPERFETYRLDTYQGLERMRNPETGLIRDKILVRRTDSGDATFRILNDNTSATNIGLDILNQIGKVEEGLEAPASRKNLEQVVSSLEKISFHRDSGLFYSWYSTARGFTVVNRDVSSVDNIHLALALWTVKETYHGTPLSQRAGKLLERMDFSVFYSSNTGLMAGNLKHHQGHWALENYQFANLGSEARSIYALTWALGLLKRAADPRMAEKSSSSLAAETYVWNDAGTERRILRTWDGGAFQLLLPKLLLNEERYSPQLEGSFDGYARYILAEGQRQGFPVPAAHSASNYGIDDEPTFSEVPSYHGKAGSTALVCTDHVDLNNPHERSLWDLVYTPHASLIAATADPERFAAILKRSESLRSGNDVLYVPGFGFLDGYHVKGRYAGQVVPVQISLDQGMIALALGQMRAKDGLSPSGRALMHNSAVQARLSQYYDLIDRKLAPLR